MKFGYMETPNIPKTLTLLRRQGFKFDIMATSFFLSRRSIRPAAHSGMPLWQDRIFITLGQERQRRHGLLPDPHGAGGRSGDAGDGVGRVAGVDP